MSILGRFFYRCMVIAAELAQLVVTTFGGGNGDPDVISKSSRTPRKR